MKSAQTSSNGLVTWGFANGSGGLWNLMINPGPAGIGTPGVPRSEIDGGRVVGDTTINDDIWNHVVSAYPGDSLAEAKVKGGLL